MRKTTTTHVAAASLVSIALIITIILAGTALANPGCIYVFHGQGCAHCARAMPYVEKLAEENPEAEIKVFEIYNDRKNAVLLNQLFEAYGVPDSQRGVPAVFSADRYLIGDTPIMERIDTLLGASSSCPSTTHNVTEGVAEPASPTERLKTLSLVTIISAALVDSINPCAIAVLLILMSALLMTGGRKRALFAGLAFTTSIYISYLLFGLGLFAAIQITGLAYWFAKVVGAIAILIGLANLKDFFWYGGGGFVMEIPQSWRPTLKAMLGRVTSPFGAFLMGFAVCLFELPCTGGPYIFILGMLAERSTLAYALPLLLLYNVFFVLPLLAMTGMLYLGFTSVEKATAWKDRNLRALHLVAGIVLIALGVIVVAGWA